MRIIGGSARGRPIKAPPFSSVRPTSDRVREAIFDVLSSLGGLEGRSVLDLFAGSGAFGLEAVSRGASSVVFVEKDKRVLSVIEDNLRRTGLVELAATRLLRSDALEFCRHATERFDVALVDPPYAYEHWPELLEVLPAGLVVLESNQKIDLGARFTLHRSYNYGGTLVVVARRPSSALGEAP